VALPLILVILGGALVLVASVLPGDSPAVRAVPERLQKAMHLLAYGVLAALWSWTLAGSPLGPLWRGALAAALATALGALVELIQRYRPGRYGTWGDVVLNATGAVLGTAAVGWL
jgi:VanZ family protein